MSESIHPNSAAGPAIEARRRAEPLTVGGLGALKEIQTSNSGSKQKIQARLLDTVEQSIIATDLDGIVVYWNQFAEQLYGWTSPEAIGRHIMDLTTPAAMTEQAVDILSHLRQGESWTGEFNVQRRDGTTFPAQVINSPINDENGVLIGIVGLSIDISERKQQEASLIGLTRQLERQSNLFHTTLSAITDFAYIFDREGRFLYANQPLLDLWGLGLDDAVGKNFSDLQYPPDLAVRLQEQIQQVIDTGQSLRDETPYTSSTGAEGFYEYIFTPVFAADGTVEAVAGSTRDYTERRLVEAALRDAQERLLQAMNAAKMFSWEVSPGARELSFSSNVERTMGFTFPPDIIDNPSKNHLHSDDAEGVANKTQHALETGEPYDDTMRMINPHTGEIVWMHSQGILVKNSAGDARFVGIAQNITERKHTEILLDTQKQALEMVVGGSPLTEVLMYLAGIVEDQSAGSSIASILLLDEQGRLHNGASPSLPEDYLQAIEGIQADENVGTCSAAAATCQIIVSPDIANDPRWTDLKHLPLGLGFQAAWSLPVMAADRRVLGTFGTYFREKRGPTKFERETVEILAKTAALAIERKQSEEALRSSETKLQLSHQELERRVNTRTAALSEMNAVLQEEVRQRQRIEAERVELLRRVIFAQEDERSRIAREMHDQFGQQLTVLKLKLDAVKEDCGEKEELCKQIEALQTLVMQLDADVDHMVWEMRPTALDDLGLHAALSSYVQRWSQHLEVPVQLHARAMDGDRLKPEIETTLYRIAQEALNNIAKHAHATQVAVVLERRADQVSLIVEDDGVGFDLQRLTGARDEGLGLVGMRERAALVGGIIEIESRPNFGATVVVRIPVPAARQKGERGE